MAEAAGVLLDSRPHRKDSSTGGAFPGEEDDVKISSAVSFDPYGDIERDTLPPEGPFEHDYFRIVTHRCIFSDCPRARKDNAFVARKSLYEHLRVTHKLTDAGVVQQKMSDASADSLNRGSQHQQIQSHLHKSQHDPYLCFFQGCDRAQDGNGFQRRWDMFDHMKRVHKLPDPAPLKVASILDPNSPDSKLPDLDLDLHLDLGLDTKPGQKVLTAKPDGPDDAMPLIGDLISPYLDPSQFMKESVPNTPSLTSDVTSYGKYSIASGPKPLEKSVNSPDSNTGNPGGDQTRQEAPAMAEKQSEEALIVQWGYDRAPAATPETEDVSREVPRERAPNTAAARKSRGNRTEKGRPTDLAGQPQGRERRRELLETGLSKGLAKSVRTRKLKMTYLLEPTTPNFSEDLSDSNGFSSHQEGFKDLPILDPRVQSSLTRPSRGLSSPSITDQIVSKLPPKSVCWDHGCNGRQFSTFSNLLRHQRAKAAIPSKPCCPRCGAEFTRISARDGHMQHDKCKPKTSRTVSSNLSPEPLGKEIQVSRSALDQIPLSALLENGCRSGNWISGELTQRLGKASEIIPTDHEAVFIDALGRDLVPPGQIDLHWRWGPRSEVHMCPFNVLPSSSHGIDLIFGNSYIISEAPLEVFELASGGDQVQAKEDNFGTKSEHDDDDGDGDKNNEKTSDVFHTYDDPASRLLPASNDDANNDLQEIVSNGPTVPLLHQSSGTKLLSDTGNGKSLHAGVSIQNPLSRSMKEDLTFPSNEEQKSMETFRLERSDDDRGTTDSVKQGSISRPGSTYDFKTRNEETIKVIDAAVSHPRDRVIEACYDIRVTEAQGNGFVNCMKTYIEDMTQESWDWWPLKPVYRSLKSDGVRIQWHCASGHTHYSQIPLTKLHLLDALQTGSILRLGQKKSPNLEVLAIKRILNCFSHGSKRVLSYYNFFLDMARITLTLSRFDRPASAPASLKASDSASSSDSDRRFHRESSASQVSSATSDTGSLDESEDDQRRASDRETQERDAGDKKDVIIDIIPPGKLKGFVLFGVQGAKRLQPARTRLTQIDVEACKDDDGFFDELAVQFGKLRGFFRRTLSIWQFRTCEFIMYFKANPNDIFAGPRGLPPATSPDYHFEKDLNPPVLEELFQTNFYGCDEACMKARVDILRIFHECNGRNHCGKSRVIARLPKRHRKWDIDNDEEKEEAWGLHALFGVSFYRVALYHLLILSGPSTFWGLWLRRWPRDWQNASVPFFAVVVLLSLFWLPFAHNAGSRSGKKHKVT